MMDLIECQPMRARLTERTCLLRQEGARGLWKSLVNKTSMYKDQTLAHRNLKRQEKFSMLYFCGTCDKMDLGLTRIGVLKKLFEGDQKQFKRIRLGTEDYGASIDVEHIPDLPDQETQEEQMK